MTTTHTSTSQSTDMVVCNWCGVEGEVDLIGSDRVGEAICHGCARGRRDDCHRPIGHLPGMSDEV